MINETIDKLNNGNNMSTTKSKGKEIESSAL